MDMKKVVVKLNIHDDKDKQKAMKAVSSLAGIDSIAVDMKENKMTVIGDIDPVSVVSKLRKQWGAQIVTVGPAKEEKKNEKKDEKKDEKKEEKKSEKEKIDELAKLYNHYYYYPPQPQPLPASYYVQTVEEHPNSCNIC